jgi:diphthamide synthase (EF-2-diphthine--ammonia ligase)
MRNMRGAVRERRGHGRNDKGEFQMIPVTVNGVPTGEEFSGPITVQYYENYGDAIIESFDNIEAAQARFDALPTKYDPSYIYVGDRIFDSRSHSYDAYCERVMIESSAPAWMQDDPDALEQYVNDCLGDEAQQ